MLKFVFFIIFLSASLILGGCGGEAPTNVKNNADSGKRETRNLSGFKKIKAGDSVTLEITVQKDFSVTVETGDKELQYVTTQISGDTLNITTDKDKISSVNKAVLKISMPELVELEVSGITDATVSDAKSESLKLQANNMSKIKISGETKNLKANGNGKSLILAENLKTENAEVEVNGASQATVAPTNELNAKANGASLVTYIGEPKKIKKTTTGEGAVQKN